MVYGAVVGRHNLVYYSDINISAIYRNFLKFKDKRVKF